MDANLLNEIATSQAVWAICAIAIGYFSFKKFNEKSDKQEERLITLQEEYRGDSKERENKLMEHLARSDEAQERTATAIEGINLSLHTLQGRVDTIEKNTLKS